MEKFLSSEDVFKWVSGFINLERGQKPKSFRLERMSFLAELAGHPEKCAPSIHIAGSKGKGSVTSMLTAMLSAAGFRAARYMSPHVTDIRERICLGDAFFDEEIYCAAGNELRDIAETRLPLSHAALFDTSTADGCEPTFWELLTLLFFLCARQAKCNVMVVETGMGGRLDSTNILDPLVSVITLIELEHTSFLGNTIAEVAGEKAGIIKNGKPFVLAAQCEEALQVFKKKAQETNSTLYYIPETLLLSEIKITNTGTEFNIKNNNLSGSSEPLVRCPCEPLFLPIPGKVQAENAALAITALKIAFPQINEDAICSGLKNLKIPGRFENMGKQLPFIIDGAHTPESLHLCIETFCSLYGEGNVLIFGCAADKDDSVMANIAHSHFSKIFITTPGTFKASDPAKVYEAFCGVTSTEKAALVMDTQEAVRQAQEFAKEKSLPILATGSFYLVSEIRKELICFYRFPH
ncbi:MAG: bifunctional folylpolyglutamate synthase/dihydrofolate synthase [Treponema sp.]|nr:bifunctional folylpolyglutamate synthase/dihydrofolate synthase [Treponema sp.]MCL2237778.1 bifunctional folylpolyglutamate synthase/dihydrofolate synthase [Treponema sp.]